MRSLGYTITALKDRNVVNLIKGAGTLNGTIEADLVQHRSDKGLWFASAKRGDEPASTSLYFALAAFDAALPRDASTDDGDRVATRR